MVSHLKAVRRYPVIVKDWFSKSINNGFLIWSTICSPSPRLTQIGDIDITLSNVAPLAATYRDLPVKWSFSASHRNKPLPAGRMLEAFSPRCEKESLKMECVLFEHRYKKYAKNGKLTFTNTRQELAEYSGLSVKTVNRAVKKFEEQGLISRSGKTFYIDEGQYEQLHALVSKLIEPLIERGRNDEPDL